jgi:DNA mitochondrial polymerase exonuclease domain
MYQQLSKTYNLVEQYSESYPVDRVLSFLKVKMTTPNLKNVPIEWIKDHWYCVEDESFYSIDELVYEWTEIVFDLESTQKEKDGFWFPFLAMAIDQKGRNWVWRSPSLDAIHVPMPVRTDNPLIVFGHNIVAYDSKYFSYYLGEPVLCKNSANGHPYIFVDTLGLAQASLGLSDDDESKSKLVTAYLGMKKRLKEGIGIPSEWFSSVTMCNLSDLHQFLMGVPINKSVRDQ